MRSGSTLNHAREPSPDSGSLAFTTAESKRTLAPPLAKERVARDFGYTSSLARGSRRTHVTTARAAQPHVSLHMEDAPETKDRNGRTVRLGSRVRIVHLSQEFLNSLPEDERPLVLEMLGNIFEVDEIDSHGSAWVTKCWDRRDGTYDAHGIGLSCSEMELAPEENAG